MTRWTAFVGFTGLVLTLFLVLARLSQRVVDDADEAGASARRAGHVAGPPLADGPDDASDPEPTAGERFHPESDGDRVDPGTDRTDEARPDGPRASRAAADQPLVTDAAASERPVERPERDRPGAPRERGRRGMSPGALLANVALTQGVFGALVASAAWYFEVPAAALGLAGGRVTGLSAVAVGVAFGAVLWVGNELASGLADAAGASYDEGLRTMLAPAGIGGWALLLGATLPIIAVVEEFLFRAAALGAPSAAFGAPWAFAALSSVLFALGHGAQGRVGIVVTGALGFALAAGFVLTESFLVVAVAHYLVNALEFGLHEGLDLPDPVWS